MQITIDIPSEHEIQRLRNISRLMKTIKGRIPLAAIFALFFSLITLMPLGLFGALDASWQERLKAITDSSWLMWMLLLGVFLIYWPAIYISILRPRNQRDTERLRELLYKKETEEIFAKLKEINRFLSTISLSNLQWLSDPALGKAYKFLASARIGKYWQISF